MNKEIVDALNCIIEFLAVRDLAQMSKDALKKACGASKADVIIALGSDLPVVAETACELYKAGYGEKLMFCGGIGHSTVNLKKKVAKILNVETDQLPESEAEIYACLAKDKYQIESSSIFMDKTSTNTSENIKNAIQIFNDHTIKHETMILIQDPILQKRSYVTALDMFNYRQKIINYAPIIPKLNSDGTIENDTPYLWEGTRLYELALGEVYRLRDDENGYGPKGKGQPSTMKEGEHHMKQIMIMSHSIFAEGIKSACEDMLGPQNDIITIGFTNNAEFEKTISDKLDKIPEEDELILLFDSMRGTPCTAVIELLRKKNISKKSLLLTGINLPVLEQVIRYKEEMSLEELKDKVMQLAVISIAGTTLSFQKNGIS